MNKIMFTSLSLATFGPSSYAPIYKSFEVNGEIINFWAVTDSIIKYDTKGNKIYYKNSIMERWQEYNDNGNLIHYKDSKRYERWWEYDANGNEIHNKTSKGYEEWYEYEYYTDGTLSKLIKYKRF